VSSAVRPYLSIEQLAALTPWSVDAIRRRMQRGFFRPGLHFFQPAGPRREVIFKWAAVQELIECGGVAVAAVAPVRGRRRTLDVEKATAELRGLLDRSA
jgi:hypothetical protein